MSIIRSNPALLEQHNKIERQVRDYKRIYGSPDPTQRLTDPNGEITIPIVVHIIHPMGQAIGTGANLSVAQIQSQIDVLNEDFSRMNPDAGQTPNAFTGVAGNPMFRFILACKDPNGLGTTGITRTASNVANFTPANNAAKFTNQGGINAWPTNRYLNIWVVPAINGGALLGYAQNIMRYNSDPNTDGVVVAANVFGRGAGFNLDPQFNLGRTLTHEVGHWLNVIHIWGLSMGTTNNPHNCNDSDESADTPNQWGFTLGAPAFPTGSCNNGANGNMFMNFMDLTEDATMNIFTNDQRARMRAVFMPEGVRASFIDNYFSLTRLYNDCSLGYYLVRTPFCAAENNITWSITGPATIGSSGSTFKTVVPQTGANGTVVLTASWDNFTSDTTFTVGYGSETSTYNPNCYNLYNTPITEGSTNMTCYNNWTYLNVSFSGATGVAKNWRLVYNSHPTYVLNLGSGNQTGVYLTAPYALTTIRAEIPTTCGDKTVEYSFLGGYLNPVYVISPNPATNEIQISASGLTDDPNARVRNSSAAYEVQIFNRYSQLLKKTICPSGSTDLNIDISRLSSNQLYTVKLISNGNVQVKSFFKQ
jgi:hypothetical protein